MIYLNPNVPIVIGPVTINHFGTNGNDTMTGSSYFRNRFHGSNGQDTMIGAANYVDTVDYSASPVGVDVRLDTGRGYDGHAEGDTYESIENVVGSAYDDDIQGRGAGIANVLDGGAGNDKLTGWSGNDTLKGGTGNDELYGGQDADWLYGGTGNDILGGGADDNVIDGGAGSDTLSLSSISSTSDAYVTLYENGNGLLQQGTESVALTSIEHVNGSGANDWIWGNSDDNTLEGGYGEDHLFGGNGDDTLDGGKDDDVIDGGRGSDDMWGGSGRDTFVLDNDDDDEDDDVIHDFSVSLDQIDLSATDEFGDEDFDDLMDEADQVGGDVVIDMGDGSLTLIDVQLSELSESNFIF